jgi:hypothetical protein
MSLPEFNDLGYLPPGVYEMSWQEFMQRFVVNPHRQRLATGLAAALRKLGIAGCRRVIIGGSFVTNPHSAGTITSVLEQKYTHYIVQFLCTLHY